MFEWNGFVVVRVSVHFGLSFGEGFYHVWTGADRTLFCKVDFAVGVNVHNDEERVAQHTWEGSDWFLGVNGDILAVSGDVIQFEHSLRTWSFGKGTFNGFLNCFAGHWGAVGEFNVLNLEGPGHLVVGNFPAFSNPWFCVHLVIEVNQTFADAITHNLPAKVVVGRFQAICKVGNTYGQGIFRAFGRTAAVAAASCETKSHESCCCHKSTFFVNRFHCVRFLS